MGLRSVFSHFAETAAVPVFAVAGGGAREAVGRLRQSPTVELVDTPAAATILLVAGSVPPSLNPALTAVHDAMPSPRGTIHWPLGADQGELPTTPSAPPIGPSADAADAIAHVFRALLSGAVPSEQPIQPSADPNPWRGIGPYGQGGSGMTGGTPYGRPMAELAPDRDGLRLDVLPLSVGPFFPRFPVGVTLEVVMAGDVVIEGRVTDSPFIGHESSFLAGPFLRALSHPTPVAEIELARAREHLRWASSALVTQGLPALAMRVLRLAATVTPDDATSVTALIRRVRLLRVPQWSGAGVGRLAPELLPGLGLGPVSRAAGLRDDARSTDPAYLALGFEPILGHASDAAERWRLRLDEASQSLELARRAGAQRTEQTGVVESPRGRLHAHDAPFQRLQPVIPDLLAGLEWGDAVTALVSLDLDPEEAGAAAIPSARAGAA